MQTNKKKEAKMKVIDSPIPDNVWMDLKQKVGCRPQSAPEGFESVEQIMNKIDRGYNQTKRMIRKLVQNDLVDVIVVGRQGAHYYRPKNYAKQNKR
mgnify:CR=1 FL=1|jgi:hypothetical protein